MKFCSHDILNLKQQKMFECVSVARTPFYMKSFRNPLYNYYNII